MIAARVVAVDVGHGCHETSDRTGRTGGRTPLLEWWYHPLRVRCLRPCRSEERIRTFDGMRYSSTVTSVSWIPSEAVKGVSKPIFELGVTHYDEPLPDHLDDLDAWRDEDRFRFANRLSAWIDVEDGQIVAAGYSGGGLMGATTVRLGVAATFAAVAFDDIQRPVEITDGRATFVADRRWSHRGPGTAAREPATLRAPPVARGVDDPRAHARRAGRHRVRRRRRLALPPALDLRRGGRPRGEGGPHGLQGLVSRTGEREHALGRRGQPRTGDGGRDGPRARAGHPHHAVGRQAEGAPGEAGQAAHRTGSPPGTTSTSSSTASCRSTSTASRSPRWGPAPSWGSGPSSRVGSAPHRCARSRRSVWPWPVPTRSSRP